jgi:hypothetical protein
MSKYLISTVETYRVDSEPEVEIMLEQAKNANEFELKKYTSEKKEKKDKKSGEIIDSYYKVALHKEFNDIKDPYSYVNVVYEVD